MSAGRKRRVRHVPPPWILGENQIENKIKNYIKY
jgi:hypothetical protein